MALVLPGQPLFEETQGAAGGSGTYTLGGTIYSSLVGEIQREGNIVSVKGKAGLQTAMVPDVGSIVVGTVTRISRPHATIAIQTVDGRVSHNFEGIIRSQDVRQTEKDKVKIWNSFRPGDVVRAQLSLGDVRSYFLSTAGNHLGVVHATSENGNPLQPQNWETMLDTATNKTEPRKVAGPKAA